MFLMFNILTQILYLVQDCCKVLTKETWKVGKFIIAQMVRRQLATKEQMK